MNILLSFIAAILPPALLWLYIWRKDPQKEPMPWLLRATLAGMGICIPVVLIEFVAETILFGADGEPTTIVGTTLQSFFVAALPEEGMKLLVLWLLLRRNPYFDEHFDGIVYAVCVGLGFATIENISYVITDEAWMAVASMRALLAVPGHYAFAILMGYYYSRYRFVDHTRKTAVLTLLAPVLAHGVYDSLIFSSNINPYIAVPAFIVLIVFCIRMHLYASRKVNELIERDRMSENQECLDSSTSVITPKQ